VLDRHGSPTWMPWPTVFARAALTCRWLRGIGVERKDRVALVFPTVPAFFDALFGVLLAGAVPVPLYPPVRLGRFDDYCERTASMLHACGARTVLADARVRSVLGEVIRRARPALGCHSVPTYGAVPAAPPVAPAGPSPGDLALVQFSSGTTRDPKPVALTHRAIVAQTSALNGFWPDEGETRHSGVSWLPLYHDMGLVGCVFAALERPGTLTLVPPEVFVTRPASWLQAISTWGATVSAAPNFAYSVAAERVTDAEMQGVDLSCWRVALCGAEAIVPSVLRSFQRRFAPWGLRPEALTPVYGLSEAALAVTFSNPHGIFVSRRFDRRALAAHGIAREAPGGREVVSVGSPLPGFAVRVVDEERRDLGQGLVGNIECRGPSLMEGYLGLPEATAEVLRDGWLATGDTGTIIDAELYLTGRSKDMLLLRGRNSSPEEVEAAVHGVDGVRNGCVVALSWLPEEADGEELLVFAEARRRVPGSRFEEIAAACHRSIVAATQLVPARVLVLAAGTLPRTSSGKLRRQETLRRHLAGELRAPARVSRLRIAAITGRSAFAYLRARMARGRRGRRLPPSA
jgi:fatty-acyl-CoA synthase